MGARLPFRPPAGIGEATLPIRANRTARRGSRRGPSWMPERAGTTPRRKVVGRPHVALIYSGRVELLHPGVVLAKNTRRRPYGAFVVHGGDCDPLEGTCGPDRVGGRRQPESRRRGCRHRRPAGGCLAGSAGPTGGFPLPARQPLGGDAIRQDHSTRCESGPDPGGDQRAKNGARSNRSDRHGPAAGLSDPSAPGSIRGRSERSANRGNHRVHP
jgi:hypothetical protein